MHYAKYILKRNIIQILFIYLTIGSRSAGVAVMQFENSERRSVSDVRDAEGDDRVRVAGASGPAPRGPNDGVYGSH